MSTKSRAGKRHDSLHRVNWTPNWVFRRYSAQKGKEFVKSTGIPSSDANAAKAYKRGLELYDEWLADVLPSGRPILIKDIARALKASKEARKKNTKRTFKNQIDNHIIPEFGHLLPSQVTSLRWETYDAKERAKGKRTKLYNTRKALKECLSKAFEEGLIKKMPKLKNFDQKAAPPRSIERQVYRRIRREAPWPVKLLIFIMYYQGARPNEVMQYEWTMILLNHGKIAIPGEITKTGRSRTIPLNSRVLRALRWLRRRLDGEGVFPKDLPAWFLKAAESPYLIPGRDSEKPLSAYNAVWDRVMAELKLDYTIYNFRDTFITNCMKRGLNTTFIGKYTDTSAKMIDEKYAVPDDDIMIRVAA